MPRKSENRFLKKKKTEEICEDHACMHVCMYSGNQRANGSRSEEKTVMLMRNTVLCGGCGSQRGPPATQSL